MIYAYQHWGKKLENRNDPKKLLHVFSSALKKFPRNKTLKDTAQHFLLKQAAKCMQRKEYPNALLLLKEIYKISPRERKIHQAIGVCSIHLFESLFHSKKYRQAIKYYEELRIKLPYVDEIKKNFIYVVLKLSQEKTNQKKHRQAIRILRYAYPKFKNHRKIREMILFVFQEWGKHWIKRKYFKYTEKIFAWGEKKFSPLRYELRKMKKRLFQKYKK